MCQAPCEIDVWPHVVFIQQSSGGEGPESAEACPGRRRPAASLTPLFLHLQVLSPFVGITRLNCVDSRTLRGNYLPRHHLGIIPVPILGTSPSVLFLCFPHAQAGLVSHLVRGRLSPAQWPPSTARRTPASGPTSWTWRTSSLGGSCASPLPGGRPAGRPLALPPRSCTTS